MSETSQAYRVLARKYRPQTLTGVVGQDNLVRTLTQAIEQNRLPHAFVLHGIRGVGKTTTARIIAKAINCVGPDGQGQPTPNPCGQCPSCISISEDRHMDVVEMDAASRTGVDDIREVIDSAKYKAVNGRYKIYIIDEVHMLSKSAFNALLKTLEEPPPHVKFIFATTELKKIPDTVLSRCMRFDLARITPSILFDYFKHICAQESVTIEDEGLALIVRAADGSARDGLSLLDQAISLSKESHITTALVRDMLGLIDRGRTFRLLSLLMSGQIPEALGEIRDIYDRGGEPTIVLQDLLDLVYWITCLKTSPALKSDVTWPESDRRQGTELAQQLSMPALMRAWQVLSKGYEEVTKSPLPNQAAEMVIIRLGYLSDMPSAEDLLKLASGGGRTGLELRTGTVIPATSPVISSGMTSSAAAPPPPIAELQKPIETSIQAVVSGGKEPVETPSKNNPTTFEELVDLFATAKEPFLYSQLMQDVHLISFAPSKLEIRMGEKASKHLPRDCEAVLLRETGTIWKVLVSQEEGLKTIVAQDKEDKKQEEEEALNHPIVQELLTTFPQANAKVN